MIYTQEQVGVVLKSYLASRMWWMFVYAHDNIDKLSRLEGKFYSGAKNAKFHIFITTHEGRTLPLILAAKENLSKHDLIQFLRDMGSKT